MPPSKSLTWLHLSDIHLSRVRNGPKSNNLVELLLSDLRACEQEFGFSPDFLFFTGDIAFGRFGARQGEKIEDQFQEGADFLNSVRNVFRTPIPAQNCFVVPGNHDIDRSMIAASDNAWLGSATSKSVRKMLDDNQVQWKRFSERLNPFRKFIADNGYDHASFYDQDHLIFSETRNISGYNIGIAGFNTTWSSQGDKEKGQLRMGAEWQLELLRDKMPKADLSIALMHHPSNWLVEDEDPQFLRLIQKQFTVSLHGHEHQNWVNIDAGHLRIAAASCHGDVDYLDGYNFVHVDLDNRAARVWLRKYDPLGGQFIPNVIATHTDTMGCWNFENLRFRRSGESHSDASPMTLNEPNKTTGNTDKLEYGVHEVDVAGKTAFVAVMMAGASEATYGKRHSLAQRISRFFLNRLKLSKVHCPAARINSPKSWDPADRALREGLELIRKCHIFVLVYTESMPSSVLVEAGFALALFKPSLYLVQKGVSLPYLLESAGQAFPDVKVVRFSDPDHLLKILSEHGEGYLQTLFDAKESVHRRIKPDGI